jgi:hypothetical protein
MEKRIKLSQSEKRANRRSNCTVGASVGGEVLPPEVVSFSIAPDWSISVDLSIAKQGYPTMTPLSDISLALEQEDLGSVSDHSIRDRMRYVDHAINDVVSLIYLFIGPRRTDAFYEQQANISVPKAINRLESILAVLRTIQSREPAPPPPSGQGPRHRKRA